MTVTVSPYHQSVRWASKNRAGRLAGRAIRSGILVRPPNCSVCDRGDIRIIGHHDDYTKPLDVRWLCDQCHYDFHHPQRKGRHTIKPLRQVPYHHKRSWEAILRHIQKETELGFGGGCHNKLRRSTLVPVVPSVSGNESQIPLNSLPHPPSFTVTSDEQTIPAV